MPIRQENIGKVADVVIAAHEYPGCKDVCIEFGRIPDSDVVADLEALGNTPGYKLSAFSRAVAYRLNCPLSVDLKSLLREIKRCLEQDHNLVVEFSADLGVGLRP